MRTLHFATNYCGSFNAVKDKHAQLSILQKGSEVNILKMKHYGATEAFPWFKTVVLNLPSAATFQYSSLCCGNPQP